MYKCKYCNNLDGYICFTDEEEDEAYSDPFAEEYNESQFSEFEAELAKQDGSPIISASAQKKIADAIKKHEKSSEEKCKKRLRNLVNHKYIPLRKAGVTSEIIKKAIFKVGEYICRNGKKTDNQLLSLFFAAIYNIQDDLVKEKRYETRLTRRDIQEISGIDRKTIRKYKAELS